MKTALVLLLFLFAFYIHAQEGGSDRAAPTPLDPVLQAEDLWTLSPDQFMVGFGQLGFQWVSEARQAAEARWRNPAMLGESIDGVIVRFAGEKPSAVEVLFYGRGDSGDLMEGKFQELLKKTIGTFTSFGGAKRQQLGGHMRLIIGNNEKTQEIMYSDSWGPGHEMKRMAPADAWTITTSLSTLEPL